MTKEKHKQNISTPFVANTKLADMIEVNYKLLSLLSQFGIGLGFGETTIDSACKQRNISTQAFLTICNIYTFADFEVSKSNLQKANIADIVLFLRQSHKYYEKQIEQLRNSLDLLLSTCKQLPQQTLKNFLNDYTTEVKNHFDYEENMVFPYIDDLLKNKNATDGYNIEQFEKNHSNIEEKLNDLKSIIIKYFPKDCDEDIRYHTLFLIFNLKEDLQKHTFIEDNILIPLVEQLENR